MKRIQRVTKDLLQEQRRLGACAPWIFPAHLEKALQEFDTPELATAEDVIVSRSAEESPRA
jgi:hypothetical protein